ncbi:MAG TPA: glycosyltransferase family A protein [Thermoanaerobaculia bacterium]|nr:glycosyltransferase family A protein [Thermoanaerobaculia bacterium]
MSTPFVSVLVPVFNGERFLDEAVASVLRQDFADFELLVVDDGSTDRTPELLRAWCERDGRVVVVTAPRNLGISAASNLGLRQARGTYVARLDSDDVMMPGRLAAQAALLDARPDVVMVSSAYEVIDEAGRVLGAGRSEEAHEVVQHLLGFYNSAGGNGRAMYRRDALLRARGYREEYSISVDYDLAVRLLRLGRFATLPMLGIQQREHGAQSTNRFRDRKREVWSAIMRDALTQTLQREVTPQEIDALITVWRIDGALGMASIANHVMREAYARFCSEHAAKEHRAAIRRRTANQWVDGARFFWSHGQRAEAARYAWFAVRWHPAVAWQRLGARALPYLARHARHERT